MQFQMTMTSTSTIRSARPELLISLALITPLFIGGCGRNGTNTPESLSRVSSPGSVPPQSKLTPADTLTPGGTFQKKVPAPGVRRLVIDLKVGTLTVTTGESAEVSTLAVRRYDGVPTPEALEFL